MTLHLVFSTTGLSSCQSRQGKDDKVVLIGDGAYAARRADVLPIFALAEDLQVRGVQPADGVLVIEYVELIELCTEHNPIVSWRD